MSKGFKQNHNEFNNEIVGQKIFEKLDTSTITIYVGQCNKVSIVFVIHIQKYSGWKACLSINKTKQGNDSLRIFVYW